MSSFIILHQFGYKKALNLLYQRLSAVMVEAMLTVVKPLTCNLSKWEKSETSCYFGKGFISESQSVPKGTSSTAFCSYSSSFRLRIPDAFTAPNPNAMNSAAPTHRSQFVMELFPVWGRLTSALEESVPVPVFGSTV